MPKSLSDDLVGEWNEPECLGELLTGLIIADVRSTLALPPSDRVLMIAK